MRIEITTGSEGPRFDPYSFEEITVRRASGKKVTIHLGLREFVEVDDLKREPFVDGPYSAEKRYAALEAGSRGIGVPVDFLGEQVRKPAPAATGEAPWLE